MDTKKQLKADYKLIARVMLLSWVIAIKETDWLDVFGDIALAIAGLIDALSKVLIFALFAALFPITFPVACLIAKLNERRRRLDYLRRQLAADEDF